MSALQITWDIINAGAWLPLSGEYPRSATKYLIG
jgi:hypothetical protein